MIIKSEKQSYAIYIETTSFIESGTQDLLTSINTTQG
jgi:hypothetical protein